MSLFSQMTTKAVLKRVAIGQSATSAPTKTMQDVDIKCRIYELYNLSDAERALAGRDGVYPRYGCDVRPTLACDENDEIWVQNDHYRIKTIKDVKIGGGRVHHKLIKMAMVT